MKQLNTTIDGFVDLSRDEAEQVTGGGEILNYMQCVSGAMGTGGGLLRTFLLGATIFGMARLCGVMVGCSSL